jgi:hypothetical protein
MYVCMVYGKQMVHIRPWLNSRLTLQHLSFCGTKVCTPACKKSVSIVWPGGDSLSYVGVCCKPLAIQVLRKGYKELENTGPDTVNRTFCGAVVRRLGTILPTVPVSWPVISISLDSLNKTWLESDFQQTVDTLFFHFGMQSLVTRNRR